MNQDIPFEHQMMFIVKDYDRKVEENMGKWKNYLQPWKSREFNCMMRKLI